MNMLTPTDWHDRFTRQSRWTAQVRRFLYDGLNLSQAKRGLEVGCGTGVIAADLAKLGVANMVGIDLRADFLDVARQQSPQSAPRQGERPAPALSLRAVSISPAAIIFCCG